ncbi:MAG: bifunctional 5,10-methylenetetrahydrofolate dehydrogenase/5,10-methenyltetrahydrofolate cyclohydrolase [Clostridia bacterium]|nr:bifunctional 5,10-methylenetetrahydrofolate dehydrogenase/5,10-methenyltetrahydrofolate cyclohydrolase [Clostridia bacterium]
MMILDGKATAKKIREGLKDEIATIGEKISLAVILVGNDPASEIYVANKIKACREVGIESILKRMPATATEDEIKEAVKTLNEDDSVDGILVQLPLPKGVDSDAVVNTVVHEKDVDGLTYYLQGLLAYGVEPWAACTPSGIIKLFDEYAVELEGKRAVVIGRSELCGKPLAALLTERNATVTLCHSKTVDLKSITLEADVVAVCVGKPKFLTADMVKEGAIVVDVGVHRLDGGIVGDVDPETFGKCSYYTPVPGGVGPMTIATLLVNTLAAHKKRLNKK